MCGLGLLVIVGIASRFSRPAARSGSRGCCGRKAGDGDRRGRGRRGRRRLAASALLGLALGSSVGLRPPNPQGPLVVVLAGQAIIALAEEMYYRGLAPGGAASIGATAWASRTLRRADGSRSGLTSFLFGMEHGGLAGWVRRGAAAHLRARAWERFSG